MIIISMHLNQTVVTFTDNEKYELQNIMNGFKVQSKDLKLTSKSLQNRQDLELKSSIINFIKSKKIDLQEKYRCIQRIKDFLIQEKCIQMRQNNLIQSFGHDQVCTGLQKLRNKINEIQRNHQNFEIFISFLEEMKELKEEQIYQFEYKLSKATKLSRIQRETLALIAKKIVKVQSLSKMNDIEDEIIGFISKIIRYGIHQEFKELQRIGSMDMKNKCYKLLQYLQNNCIEIRQEFSPVRSLLKKLSTSIYDKIQISKNLNDLPQNLRVIFEPLCAQIFRLREGSSKSSLIGGETGMVYVSHDMKKAQEQIMQSLRRECEQSKKKYVSSESELKRIKIILQKFSYLNNLFKEESLYMQIEKELESSSEQIKVYLERIYDHLKMLEGLSLGTRKASFVERKDKEIQFLQEKLHYALQQLDVLKLAKMTTSLNESFVIDENSCLKSESCQNSRVIHEYQDQMSSLNGQINENYKQISNLESELIEAEKKLQSRTKENAELQKQINQLLNLKNQQESLKSSSTQLRKSHKIIEDQLKTLRTQNETLLQELKQRQNLSKILQQKNKQIDNLKHFQADHSQLLHMIGHLNHQIQANKAKNIYENQKQDFTQTIQQQITQQETSSEHQIEAHKLEFEGSKEKSDDLEHLKLENEQLKQQRTYRLNQQREMKRLYKEQREDVNQIQHNFTEQKQKYEKLLQQYDALKSKCKEPRTEENQRKLNISSYKSLECSAQLLQRDNMKRMQQKHRLLERNFEEVKKYNDLIKVEYQKLKQDTTVLLKSKINQVLRQHKQNEMKLKRDLVQIAAKNQHLEAKVAILQEQNLNIKVQLQSNSKKDCSNDQKHTEYLSQSLTLKYQLDKSDSKEKFKTQLRESKIKSEQQRMKLLKELRQRQEEISLQRIQILRLEQRLDQIPKSQQAYQPSEKKTPPKTCQQSKEEAKKENQLQRSQKILRNTRVQYQDKK